MKVSRALIKMVLGVSLKRNRYALIMGILIISAFLIYGVSEIYADRLSVVIRVVDESGSVVRNAFITIWAWYPNKSSKLILKARTDEKGIASSEFSWAKLVGKWISRVREGKIEEVALIINVYVPDKSIAVTDTLILNVKAGNPHQVSKVIRIKTSNNHNEFRAASESPNVEYSVKSYTPIVEYSCERRERTNLAHVKTDENSYARLFYGLMIGDKWAVRLLVGYTYSDYTTVSNIIYTQTYTRSVSAIAKAGTPRGYPEEGWISAIMTIRFEIIGYYWQDENGNLVLAYKEFRLWAYDIDVGSLSATKGEDPYWGAYQNKLLGEVTGKGFDAEDDVILISNFDLYYGSISIIEVPISMALKAILKAKFPALGFSVNLLPDIKIVFDHAYWRASFFEYGVWGREGYTVYAYGKFYSVHGAYFSSIEIVTSYPNASPGWTPD